VSRAGRFLGAVGLGWILTANGLAAATPGPEEVVRQTVDEVVAILQDPALDDQERRTRIEALAYERFHFETVSRLVLGRDWRRFTEAQRQEFMVEFRLLLSRSYGERINRYEQEKVDILKVRDEPRGDVTVVTRIRGGAADGVEIAYRMRERDESWGVIDVTVEGTGLVSNYKSQFKELLGNGSPDDLLERLRKKNRTGAVPASPTTTTAGS
jgi:phospholipid transport system substrate-binding protein